MTIFDFSRAFIIIYCSVSLSLSKTDVKLKILKLQCRATQLTLVHKITSMARLHNYFVYILECADQSYYVGVTNDLETRLQQHENGEHTTAYTYTRRPLILKYYLRFDDINHAIEFEKQVKGWSRKKKEALFIEDWDEISRLSNLKNNINKNCPSINSG